MRYPPQGSPPATLTKRPRAKYTASSQAISVGTPVILECATQVENTLTGGTITTTSSQWKYTANKDISLLVHVFIGLDGTYSFGANTLLRVHAYIDAVAQTPWLAVKQVSAAGTLNMRFAGTQEIYLASGEALDIRGQFPAAALNWDSTIIVTELN